MKAVAGTSVRVYQRRLWYIHFRGPIFQTVEGLLEVFPLFCSGLQTRRSAQREAWPPSSIVFGSLNKLKLRSPAICLACGRPSNPNVHVHTCPKTRDYAHACTHACTLCPCPGAAICVKLRSDLEKATRRQLIFLVTLLKEQRDVVSDLIDAGDAAAAASIWKDEMRFYAQATFCTGDVSGCCTAVTWGTALRYSTAV